MEHAVVSKSRALKDYLTTVAALPRLDAGAQAGLERAAQAGDTTASLALTESFLGYVVAEAALRRGLGLKFEALIAAGNRGLAEALRQTGGRLRLRVRREVRRSLKESLARAQARRATAS
jgi:DNA-directed RNA polymerase sigma subunit (sigma70/sigma32)